MTDEYFSFPAAYGLLADVAQKSDPEAFIRSAGMLDMEPTEGLRALAYFSFLMSFRDQGGEEDQKQVIRAQSFVAGMQALFARMLEHQNDASIMEMIADPKAA